MKRKRTIIVLLTIIILTITLLAGCINPFLPIYEKTDEDGISVIIDGVRYKELPSLHWGVNPSLGKRIGYAGSWDIYVSEARGDTERSFVFLQYFGTDYYSHMLYRTDKDIPDMSINSVDKIIWGEYSIKNSVTANIYSYTIEDKEIIEGLFDLLNNGEKTEDFNSFKIDSDTFFMSIRLLCSDLSGASYRLNVGHSNGKIVFGTYEDKYIEIPMELLEKIAGKKIDFEELLMEENDS